MPALLAGFSSGSLCSVLAAKTCSTVWPCSLSLVMSTATVCLQMSGPFDAPSTHNPCRAACSNWGFCVLRYSPKRNPASGHAAANERLWEDAFARRKLERKFVYRPRRNYSELMPGGGKELRMMQLRCWQSLMR